MSIRFFGLDGEMTAADIQAGGRLFQIGICAHQDAFGRELAGSGDVFSMLMNPGSYRWERQAETIHGFTEEELLSATPAEQVDELLVQWLNDRGVIDDGIHQGIAIGFNVGSFDLPHLRLVLPRTCNLFSRRSVDLNALCFSLDGAPYFNEIWSWSEWKDGATEYAKRVLSTGVRRGQAHDAGFDAQLHLLAWRFLSAAMRGNYLVFPSHSVAEPESLRVTRSLLLRMDVEKIGRLSGVPTDFILGWAKGGRATNQDWIRSLLQVEREG